MESADALALTRIRAAIADELTRIDSVVPAKLLKPFSAEAAGTMNAAFTQAWQALVRSGSPFAERDQARATKEVLALRIIDMARIGESDPVRLKDDALRYLASAMNP